MVTVKKVAELANVSPSTVSRVINGAENVNPEIRERVKKVISETGYFPNNAARSLVNRKTGAIAVLIRNLHKPFFYDLLRGMKDAATAMHKCVLFCNLSDEKEERNKYMQFLTNGIVDSMILYGTLYTDWHRQLVAKGIIIKATTGYIEQHREELKKKYKTFHVFNDKFEIDDAFMADIRLAADKEKIKFDEEQYNRALPLVRTQLKALIARDLWDMSEYYQVMNATNESVQQALKVLREGKYLF